MIRIPKRFDPAENQKAALQSVNDEELFETYLEARLQQAVAALNAARHELSAQPEDFGRATEVMHRVYELRDLRMQRDVQRSRVRTARAAAGLDGAAADETAQPVTPVAPGAAFRAVQMQHAERIIAALAARPHTCPACQAMLAADAARCHCGSPLQPHRTRAVTTLAHPASLPARSD